MVGQRGGILLHRSRRGHFVGRLVDTVMRFLRAIVHPVLRMSRRWREQQKTTRQNHAKKDAAEV